MKKTAVFSPTLETRYVNPALFEKIKGLSLELIANRMIMKHGWTRERTDIAIEGYRKFLYMTQMFDQPVSPTGDIDMIWHEHILHTNKYANDCQKLFGNFLHHFPTPPTWASKDACVGGDCEGTCSNDSCDSGTTNCQGKVAETRIIDFDNPLQEGHPKAVQCTKVEKMFFLDE